MDSYKNILWAVLLTFVLGYIVSSATAGSEAGSTVVPQQLRPLQDGEGDDADAGGRAWDTVSVSQSLPSSFAGAKANTITRGELLNVAFGQLTSNRRPLRILHIGDSHVAGKTFPLAVKETLQRAWGCADADTSAFIFSFIGKNGATVSHFSNTSYMDRIAAQRPDLIIVSFGTNECHGLGYREEDHKAQLETFFAMLRDNCPDATILLTTPPGDYFARSSVRYVRRGRGRKRRRVVSRSTSVNPMSVRCAATIEAFGAEHGLAVWDLNTIAGGQQAQRNWTAASLMRSDRIHFTPQGYALHGHLLGEALLNAYNDFVRQ